MQYEKYLQTPHWKQTRDDKLALSPACQVCKSTKSIQVHHKKYTHNGESILFNERPQDLITLCSSCHRLIHRYFGISVYKINKKICRVRRLLELGILRAKAFWIVSNPEVYEAVYQKIT